MGLRKPPTEFTIKRGRLIQRARKKAEFSQARLADLIGLKSREIISQYESGKIHEISERTCVGLVKVLGLRPEDLLEDPHVYQLSKDAEMEKVSNEARRAARYWDEMPEHIKQGYLIEIGRIEQARLDRQATQRGRNRK